MIPQGNKIPRYYSLYADKNFDLEEFLSILRRQGWVDHENIEIMKFTIMCLEKMAFYILYEYMIMGDGVMD